MPLRLAYMPDALAALRGVPKKFREQILRRIEGLRHNPHPVGIKRVQGLSAADGGPVYRERSGNYRVLYAVQQGEVLLVLDIGHRKEVYRSR